MLKWKTSTLKGQKRYSSTVNRDADSAGVLEALADFWSKVLDEVESQPANFSWDYIVIQFVTQCGDLIAFPMGKKSGDQMSSPFTVWLTLKDWGRAYDELPDPDESESKFERDYNKLHKGQMTLLKMALGDPAVKKRFAALKRRDSFAVFCVDEGNAEIRDRLEFLWGNRPGKRAFADAMELFTHICNKAEHDPDNSIIRSGEKIVAVQTAYEPADHKDSDPEYGALVRAGVEQRIDCKLEDDPQHHRLIGRWTSSICRNSDFDYDIEFRADKTMRRPNGYVGPGPNTWSIRRGLFTETYWSPPAPEYDIHDPMQGQERYRCAFATDGRFVYWNGDGSLVVVFTRVGDVEKCG